ncbi:MAG: hypothetical protein QW784_05885 [Acidilobaceae archaeon]
MGFPGSEDPGSDWRVWVHNYENIISGLVSGDFPEDGSGYWVSYSSDHGIASSLGMNCARIRLFFFLMFIRVVHMF